MADLGVIHVAGVMQNFTTESAMHSNWTTETPVAPPHYSLTVGFIAVIVAAFIFGSNLLPVKKFEMGDGLFFQWIYCAGIWLVGFVINIIKGFPAYRPLAMLGGFLWCTGAVLTVPIIQTIGLGQGILVWASVNLITGWAADRFGWFGLIARHANSDTMNYAGVVLCLMSACVYVFLKTTPKRPQEVERTLAASPDEIDAMKPPEEPSQGNGTVVFYEKLSPIPKRVFGTVLAVIAGTLYGFNFVPVIWLQENCIGASSDGMDYVFSHFCGIFVTSSTCLAVYCAVMRNRPRIYPQVILPGLFAGVLWGVADVCWFIANDALFPSISFPIITTLPALIGAMWGMFAFGEIKGRKNYIILAVAIFLAVCGAVLTGLSKSDIAGKAPPLPHVSGQNCSHL